MSWRAWLGFIMAGEWAGLMTDHFVFGVMLGFSIAFAVDALIEKKEGAS